MNVNLDQLNGPLLVWHFVLSPLPNDNGSVLISNTIKDFVETWKSHGQPVKGAFEMRGPILLVLAEDNGEVGGCSKDGLFKVIGDLELTLDISFTNRLLIPIREHDGSVIVCNLNLLKEKLNTKDHEFHVWDTTISNIDSVQDLAFKPIENTWLAKYAVNAVN